MTLLLEVQESREVTEADLLSVYALFPRKGPGKQDGLKVLAKTVKTHADLVACRQAVENFVKTHVGKEKAFIRHFDRWARSWKDWLELEETAPVVAKRPPTAPVVSRVNGTLEMLRTAPKAPADELRQMAAEALSKLKGGGT